MNQSRRIELLHDASLAMRMSCCEAPMASVLMAGGQNVTLTTYDLPEVRQFVTELTSKRTGCLDGQYCSTFDKLIACQLQVCQDLNRAIATWNDRVFRGLIQFDPAVEAALREQIGLTLEGAEAVVKLAYDREAECFEFARLDELEDQTKVLNLLANSWVSPRLAARPAFRKVLTPEEIAALRAGLATTSATDK